MESVFRTTQVSNIHSSRCHLMTSALIPSLHVQIGQFNWNHRILLHECVTRGTES